MYLKRDSLSVRETHCSDRKHRENVTDYYQKWMKKQAQGYDPTSPSLPACTPHGRPSHDAKDDPRPGMMAV